MKTINNFRDIGGYATADGQRLRARHLYRSGTLDDARHDDLHLLQAIGLKTIVDLRAPREKSKELPTIAGARRIDLPIELENKARDRMQALMVKRGAEPEVVDILKQMYRDLADEAQPQAGQLFRVLLSADAYPALIHCRAGKDRTGFLCALVQQAVGVERAAVFQDYLKTNDHFAPLTPRLARVMKIFSLGRVQVANMRAAISAREEYLQAALDQIDQRHAGLAAYLEKYGISSRELETLRGLLLE
jgi:protein-tyrosine phosphatase